MKPQPIPAPIDLARQIIELPKDNKYLTALTRLLVVWRYQIKRETIDDLKPMAVGRLEL